MRPRKSLFNSGAMKIWEFPRLQWKLKSIEVNFRGRKAGGSSSKTVNLILNGEWIETTRPHQLSNGLQAVRASE